LEEALKVQNVKAVYKLSNDVSVDAVSNVSLTAYRNEVLGIAGESGCGKSTLIKVIYGFIRPPLTVLSGSVKIHHNGNEIDVLRLTEEDRKRSIWWRIVSYIPQNAMNVLNPTMRIWEHFAEVIALSKKLNKDEAKKEAMKIAESMGLPPDVVNAYPHQLSGGMRQRVVTSLALLLSPPIVLADEPTTALDVVIQRRIIQLLLEYQRRNKATLIMVTHDMGLHAMTANRIAIMYAGKVVEVGDSYSIFSKPLHPYTQGLITSLPRIGDKSLRKGIPGSPPDLKNPPRGCRFHPRCPFAMDICREKEPPMIDFGNGRTVACWLYVKR